MISKWIFRKIVRNQQWLHYVALACILMIAIYIRAKHVHEYGFWLDEIGQMGVAADSIAKLLHDIRYHLSPPLSYLVTHIFFKFGHSEWWMRLPAMTWSVLAIAFMYGVARTRINPMAGLMAAVLALSSPMIYQYSVEARMYALSLLLATLQLFVLVRFEKRNSWKWLVVLNGIGLYTHYYFLFMIPVELLIIMLVIPHFREKWKQLGMLAGISAAVFLPWVPTLLEQNRSLHGHLIYGMNPDWNYWNMLLKDGPTYGQKILGKWVWWGLGTAFVGFALHWRNRTMRILFLWMSVPLVALFFLSFWKRTVTLRNLIVILPAYYCFAAAGIYLTGQYLFGSLPGLFRVPAHIRIWGRKIFQVFALAAVCWMIIWVHDPGNKLQLGRIGYKPPWQKLSAQIDQWSSNDYYYATYRHTAVCAGFFYDFENFGSQDDLDLIGKPWKTYQKTPGKKQCKIIGRETDWVSVLQDHGALVISRKQYLPEQSILDKLERIQWHYKDDIQVFRVK